MATPPIVIVADDTALLRTLVAGIVSHGFPTVVVIAVADGAAALAEYELHSAELLITDCEMPVMDGPTLIRQLRAQGATLPIVATSSEPAHEEVCRAAGATHFVNKSRLARQMIVLLRTLLPGE